MSGSKRVIISFTIVLLLGGLAGAAEVTLDDAKLAAQNWLTHIVRAYNSWGGSNTPAIVGYELVISQGKVVGYNFLVAPKGNILVPSRDELPPVKLYSDTATLHMHGGKTVEQADWISTALRDTEEMIDNNRAEFDRLNPGQTENQRLWRVFRVSTDKFISESDSTFEGVDLTQHGPLLITKWDQGAPYDNYCPMDGNSRSVVGCVATAASQIMRFYMSPGKSQGSTSYTWHSQKLTFTPHTYNWSQMPSKATNSSSSTQKDAVATLCRDVGYTWHMIYGADSSSASTMDGLTCYPKYFGYMGVKGVKRVNYSSSTAWMNVFQTEVSNGRPSQLKIRDPNAGGHSVVVDGWRSSPSQTVHINLGWAGSYDGWYVSDNFNTGNLHWSETSYQEAIINIGGGSSPSGKTKWGVHDNVCCKQSGSVTFWGTIESVTKQSSLSSCSAKATWQGYIQAKAGKVMFKWGLKTGCAGNFGPYTWTPSINLAANKCYYFELTLSGQDFQIVLKESKNCGAPGSPSSETLFDETIEIETKHMKIPLPHDVTFQELQKADCLQ